MSKERFQYLYQQNISKNKNIAEDDARLESLPSCVIVCSHLILKVSMQRNLTPTFYGLSVTIT